MSNSSPHSEVYPATEDPSSVPALTESPAAQPDLPRSPPSTRSTLAKIRRSISTAVGGAWRLVRKAARPFRCTKKPTVDVKSPATKLTVQVMSPAKKRNVQVKRPASKRTVQVTSPAKKPTVQVKSPATIPNVEFTSLATIPTVDMTSPATIPIPTVDVTSPADGFGSSALVESECEQGHIHPLSDITHEDSVFKASDESLEVRECSNYHLLADAKQREDRTEPVEPEGAIAPLSPTHPFMLWKKPPGMRTTWTFRTYGINAVQDRTAALETEDVIDPRFIRCAQMSGQKVPDETVGNEEKDEITPQLGIANMAAAEKDDSTAPRSVTRPNKPIMVIETVVIEEII